MWSPPIHDLCEPALEGQFSSRSPSLKTRLRTEAKTTRDKLHGSCIVVSDDTSWDRSFGETASVEPAEHDHNVDVITRKVFVNRKEISG